MSWTIALIRVEAGACEIAGAWPSVVGFVHQQAGPTIKFANRKDLVVLKGLVDGGKVTPVIGGTYPLSRTPEAIGHVGQGHARGTVVITF